LCVSGQIWQWFTQGPEDYMQFGIEKKIVNHAQNPAKA
jgi:hypothetical protein